MRTCTRKLEFDYGHRLLNHESKCAHVHGHRGVVEVTCAADALDEAGRVIDFGEIKRIVGGWIDERLDHACLVNPKDLSLFAFLTTERQNVFVMPDDKAEPSAENIAMMIRDKAAELLSPSGIAVLSVRFYETPNGWADA